MALTVRLLDPEKYEWMNTAADERNFARYRLYMQGSTTFKASMIDLENEGVVAYCNKVRAPTNFSSIQEAQLWIEITVMTSA